MNSLYTYKISFIRNIVPSLVAVALVFSSGYVHATTYQMPVNPGDTVIEQYRGGNNTTTITQDETLLDVAFRYGLGQTEIVKLNPKADRWLIKKGEVVRLPNRRVLPNTPHNGITLNIAEFRMYYYPAGNRGVVMSFAHGIGRQDWKTPLGTTTVVRKIKDPTWNPPESIRREHAANGDPLPAVVPPGPHNPLGTRAIYLNLPGEYRIHGTDVDKVYGIGMQITHGCVRMYPSDVEELYEVVPIGTPVHIVKQPIKVGWLNNVLYIEAHPDLEGEEMGQSQRYSLALDLIRKATKEEMPEIDQKALNQALKDLDGEPVAVYEKVGLAPSPLTPRQPGVLPPASPTATTVPAAPVPVPASAIPPAQSVAPAPTVAPTPVQPGVPAPPVQPVAPALPPAPDSLQPNDMTGSYTTPPPAPAPAVPPPYPSGKGSPGGYYKPVFK